MDSDLVTNPHHNDMRNNNLASVPITTLNSDSVLMARIAEEGLPQTQQTFNIARQSFLLALVMTGASAIVGFVGVGFLLTGKSSEGTTALPAIMQYSFSSCPSPSIAFSFDDVPHSCRKCCITTSGGLVSSMVFIQLAKDASDRLDKANERLDKIAAKVKDED